LTVWRGLPHPAKTAALCPDQIDIGNDELITPNYKGECPFIIPPKTKT